MSTGTSVPRALLTVLLDDAAVFPPGNASLSRAVMDHRARSRRHPWADLVGPLLVPASAVAEVAGLVGNDSDETGTPPHPLPVVLVARPGTPLGEVADGVERLRSMPARGLRLVGVELGHQPHWQRALAWGLPLVVEVDRDHGPRTPALQEVAAATRAAGPPVRVKLRTQSSPAGPVPSGEQVASFLADVHAAGLPAKLTGGLHHAVAATVPSGDPAGDAAEDQHGLLNVLLAAHLTVADAAHAEVVAVLAERDRTALATVASGLTPDQARAARTLLTSVGCCGVLDPLTELAQMGLLPR